MAYVVQQPYPTPTVAYGAPPAAPPAYAPAPASQPVYVTPPPQPAYSAHPQPVYLAPPAGAQATATATATATSTQHQNTTISPTIVNQPAPAPSPQKVVVTVKNTEKETKAAVQRQFPPGSCTICGGDFESRFTCCGIAWCILCFPCGMLCLFRQRKKRCSKCFKKYY